MHVEFHRNFKKALKKQPRRVQLKFKEKFEVFEVDQFHYSLNNHPLGGKLSGTRSINITNDIRAHYEETESGIIFMNIGSHSDLY